MASLYLANVAGNGTDASPYRPSGFDAFRYAVVMIDIAHGKTIVYSSNDMIAGAGITNFLTAVSRGELIDRAQSTSPTVGERNAIITWCNQAGYTVPSAVGNPSWWVVLHWIARQVNAAADLGRTSV